MSEWYNMFISASQRREEKRSSRGSRNSCSRRGEEKKLASSCFHLISAVPILA
jgi:hypothetical protein